MTWVNFAVLATISASLSAVRINSTAGSKRRMYLRSFASHTVKPGTTAAAVRRAIRARPLAVQAGMGEKYTHTPCGGGQVVGKRVESACTEVRGEVDAGPQAAVWVGA